MKYRCVKRSLRIAAREVGECSDYLSRAMKQELFYVGAWRGRLESFVVTSDREQLRYLLGISTARPSATELAREQAQPHPASMRSPQRLQLQTVEPTLLRQKDGHIEFA